MIRKSRWVAPAALALVVLLSAAPAFAAFQDGTYTLTVSNIGANGTDPAKVAEIQAIGSALWTISGTSGTGTIGASTDSFTVAIIAPDQIQFSFDYKFADGTPAVWQIQGTVFGSFFSGNYAIFFSTPTENFAAVGTMGGPIAPPPTGDPFAQVENVFKGVRDNIGRIVGQVNRQRLDVLGRLLADLRPVHSRKPAQAIAKTANDDLGALRSSSFQAILDDLRMGRTEFASILATASTAVAKDLKKVIEKDSAELERIAAQARGTINVLIADINVEDVVFGMLTGFTREEQDEAFFALEDAEKLFHDAAEAEKKAGHAKASRVLNDIGNLLTDVSGFVLDEHRGEITPDQYACVKHIVYKPLDHDNGLVFLHLVQIAAAGKSPSDKSAAGTIKEADNWLEEHETPAEENQAAAALAAAVGGLAKTPDKAKRMEEGLRIAQTRLGM